MKRRGLFVPLIFISSLMLAPGCGSDSTSPEDSTIEPSPVESVEQELTVPEGTYHILGPACSSTGRSPVYTELNQPVSVHDFDYLELRTKTIAGDTWTEIYQDEDCSLTITGKIAKNSGGVYQQTKERSHSWKPEYCRFEASYTPPAQAAG